MTSAQILNTGKFECHSSLLQDMSAAVGVDLAKAVLSGKPTNFPFRDMVYRCSKCEAVEHCRIWLAARSGDAGEVPEYCRNKVILEGLRDQD